MELEVRIERLGTQGDGVAQGPDGPLFVPFTLLGERVQVAIEPGKDHAEPLAILEPSPARVAPVCPHFGVCGGCALKEGVGRAKRVADLFAGIGTFTFALAGSAGVDAFEEDEAAIAALAKAARATPKLKPVRTNTRDLFRAPLTAPELTRYDAVVLDPPRASAIWAALGRACLCQRRRRL
jgi:tRNA/tmRNA/rRNA uracil-C5-methylase (TrmA/RlmC/RlmD family)